jgi:radical SAM-linked protein
MAFLRAELPILYTQGFNPLPRLEIVSPLSLGISSGGEIAAIDTVEYLDADSFKTALNKFLPEGFAVIKAMNVFIPRGGKKHSLSSLLWGFVYSGHDGTPETIKADEEKTHRQSRLERDGNLYGLERLAVLAKSLSKIDNSLGNSYFEVYRELYPDSSF